MKYQLNSDIIPIQAFGYPGCLAPMAANTSMARLDMVASHFTQSMVPKKRGMPGIFTGMEYNIGKNHVNEFARQRQNPVRVISVARKGERNGYVSRVTAIVLDLVTNEIKVMDIQHAMVVSKGVKGLQGYTCAVSNINYLTPNATIAPDMAFCSPHTHDGHKFMKGKDISVAYLTRTGITEDATLISDELAEDMAYDTMRHVVINITPDLVPINQFGTNSYQIFPSMGSNIHESGSVYLYAARQRNTSSALADQNDFDLRRVRDDDIKFEAAPYEKIVDVDYISVRGTVLPDSVYAQVNQWKDSIVTYLRTIVDSIHQVPKGSTLTPDYINLRQDALVRLVVMNDAYIRQKYHHEIPQYKVPTDIRGFDGSPVSCVQLLLTITGTCKLEKGDKVTDRSGTKGVVAAVLPKKYMPVDEFGNVADMMVMAPAVPNRGNPGQLHECMINKTTWIMSSFALPELVRTKGHDAAFDYLVSFLKEIRPEYARLIVDIHQHADERILLVNKCIKDKVIPVQWPAGYSMDPKLLLDICTKYGFKQTKVKLFTIGEDPTTGAVTVKEDITAMDVTIGNRYGLVLNKSPAQSITATSVAKVGGHGQPMGESSRSGKSLIGEKPIRSGEDEDRICRAVVDAQEVSRLTMLHANSPYGVQKMVETIITSPTPENIKRVDISNKELADTNAMLRLMEAVASVQGIELFKPATEEDRQIGLAITSKLPSIVESDKSGEE